MKKCLNFSTILFSYLLITVLVISCGGSSGGSGGGSVPQPEPKDTNCLLPDRDDKDSLVAVLCSEGVVIGEIKIPSEEDSLERSGPIFVRILTSSTESTAGSNTSRTWDVRKGGQIQISYNKDYSMISNGTVDGKKDDEVMAGDSKYINITYATGHTAESPLLLLTINSFVDENASRVAPPIMYFAEKLSSESMVTQPTNPIPVFILNALAVKTQEDFISMCNFMDPPFGEVADNILLYFLANDLDLVASDGEGAKFDGSIIPSAAAAFFLDGGDHKITLKSEIAATDDEQPAAIIGVMKNSAGFSNFTLDVDQPISGHQYVGTIVGYAEGSVASSEFISIKININSNITVHKKSDNTQGYVGGVGGFGQFYMRGVVVKTAGGAVIQAATQNYDTQSFSPAVGGFAGMLVNSDNGDNKPGFLATSLADVTLGAYNSSDGFMGNSVSIGGMAGRIEKVVSINDNIIKLAISRGNLPADFSFDKVGGFAATTKSVGGVFNNLAYVDFSNLGQVNSVGGLFNDFDDIFSESQNSISNSMVFIADGFTVKDVQQSFGAAIGDYKAGTSVLVISHLFVSSPFTDNDYNNAKLASFVHSATNDMNFDKLVLDTKTVNLMFKAGNEASNLQSKVAADSVFNLSDAKTTPTMFLGNNANWEEGSQNYPQLKLRKTFVGSLTTAEIEAAWTATNADIQTGLADRANK